MKGDSFQLRIVIVDDEPLARSGLAAAIGRVIEREGLPTMEVVALCEDGPAGIAAIQEFQPDILFLDVAMPEMDGFAMLAQFAQEELPPAVIFVTAHSEHAVHAFDVAAHDYVVKPISDARLAAALTRAVARIEEQQLAEGQRHLIEHGLLPPEGGYLQQLTIPERGYQMVVPVDEIDWIQGNQSYVRVHTADKSRLLRERLQVLEERLDPMKFFRTHRSAMVRIGAIREIRSEAGAKLSVLLNSGARAPLSRDRRAGLEAKLGRND